MTGVGVEKLMTRTTHPTLLAVDHRHPPQTAVPRVRWGEGETEQDAPVGKLRRRIVVRDLQDKRALERSVGITSGEPSILLVPEAVDGASPDAPAGLHVKEVSKVGFDAHFEVEHDIVSSLVREVVVLVDPRTHAPIEAEVEGVFGNLDAIASDECRVGELKARRVLPDRRSVEQDGLLTAELQSVSRDKASIGGEVALFLGARHLTRQFGDHDLVVEVSEHDRRSDRYFHFIPPPFVRLPPPRAAPPGSAPTSDGCRLVSHVSS